MKHLTWHAVCLAAAFFWLYAGTLHFIDPQWFEPIVPPIPGSARLWVYISGAIELALGVGFYCYFWKKNKGQTLGMQVWKVRLAQDDSSEVSFGKMVYRCLLGLIFTLLFGLNYLPMLFRKDKKTLNDILSKTFLVKV